MYGINKNASKAGRPKKRKTTELIKIRLVSKLIQNLDQNMEPEFPKRIKQTTVTQFVISGRKIYAKVDWTDYDDLLEEDLFHIRLFDADFCFEGKFSKTVAKEFSKEFCEQLDVYYRRVRETLTPVNQDLFKYDLKYNNADSATFSWKRSYEGGKVVLVHGLVSLQRVPGSNRDILLEFLLNENRTLKCAAERLGESNNQINIELSKYKEELDQFINSKSKLESQLYAKFVTLLNAKKARIKLLEEHISKYDLLTDMQT